MRTPTASGTSARQRRPPTASIAHEGTESAGRVGDVPDGRAARQASARHGGAGALDPGSRPRVEGGQRKQHKDTPHILRVVLKVDYPPESHPKEAEEMADRVLELAEKHHGLKPYDLAEIHLYWPEKEKEIHEHLIERPLKTSEQ